MKRDSFSVVPAMILILGLFAGLALELGRLRCA